MERRGVIPNSFDHIFSCIARSTNQQYLVRTSYLEIYQEEIRDLLAKDQTQHLELKERPDTGVFVKVTNAFKIFQTYYEIQSKNLLFLQDLSSFVCKSVKEIEHVMSVGNQNRSVGATNMNLRSSRSHAIFIITIEHSEVRYLKIPEVFICNLVSINVFYKARGRWRTSHQSWKIKSGRFSWQ